LWIPTNVAANGELFQNDSRISSTNLSKSDMMPP
jgi:hypothetical protein